MKTTTGRTVRFVSFGFVRDRFRSVTYSGSVSFAHIPFESCSASFRVAVMFPTQQIAQKTDANQLCRTLLVSDKARVTVMPSMEIIANDVKCTHGATICDLEDEELFYLMTRGINKIQVRPFHAPNRRRFM